MENASSIIDGSLAMAGLLAGAMVSVWALMASDSTTTLETKNAGDTVRSPLKKVA